MDDLKQLLTSHKQEHLLAHLASLPGERRRSFETQLRNVDFPLIERLVRDEAKQEDWGAIASRAKSPRSVRLGRVDNPFSAEAAKIRGATRSE